MKIGNPTSGPSLVLGPERATVQPVRASTRSRSIDGDTQPRTSEPAFGEADERDRRGVAGRLGRIPPVDEESGPSGRGGDALEPAQPEREALSRRLTRASLVAFLIYIVGAGLTYLTQLVIARCIGADSYGVYSYVLVWASLLAYAATLGFNVSLMRFVPAYQAKENWPLARGVISYACRRVLAVSVAAALASAVIVLGWPEPLDIELSNTFLIGIATVPLVALYMIGMSMLRTFGGVVTALAPERVVRDGLFMVIVVAVAWWNLWPRDATLAMGALLISSALTLVLVIVLARRLMPPRIRMAEPAYAPSDWLPSVLPLMIFAGADILMNRAGVIMLGMSGDAKGAGVFALAFNMAALVALPQVAVNTMFAPTVSDLYARGDRAGLQALFTRSAVLTLLGAAGLGIPLLLMAGPLLHWFGKDFAGGVPLICILVVGRLFAAANGPQQTLMTMVGHEKMAALLLSAGAAANVGGCALVIGSSGAVGAAVVTVATQAAWNIGMAIVIHRRLQLVPGLLAPFLPAHVPTRAGSAPNPGEVQGV